MNRAMYFVVLMSLLISCKSLDDLTGNQPIIDTANVNLAQYNQDLAACQIYADEVAVAQKATSGAIAGAAVGGVFGAVLGNSSAAGRGAGIGAVGGGARGIDDGIRERDRVVKNCLHGRGYRVLN